MNRPSSIASDLLHEPRGPISWLRLGTLLLALIAVVGAAWWYFSARGPDERNRVVHPVGYSIVKPADWTAKCVTRQPVGSGPRDLISIGPDKWIGLAPSLWVHRLAGAPDPEKLSKDGFVEGRFQEQPASVLIKKPKNYMTTLRVVIQRDGEWFEVGASLPGVEGARTDEWWRYLETFKPGPAPAAQTMQSAQPAATRSSHAHQAR